MDNATIAAMKARKGHGVGELGPSNTYKFINWFNTKIAPAIANAYTSLVKAVGSIRINWTGILVLVVLAYMAKNGILDDAPYIKWIVESAMRMTEWCLELLRTIVGWFISILDSKFVNLFDIFGIFEWMANFLRSIFAM